MSDPPEGNIQLNTRANKHCTKHLLGEDAGVSLVSSAINVMLELK